MKDLYQPKSNFVAMVANGAVPLDGSAVAAENLKLLIAYSTDADVSNRDWATMALAGRAPDTEEVRAALLVATEDVDPCVRSEALVGLVERDKTSALPLVRRELMRTECEYGTFEAAHIAADASLLEGLRLWVGRGGAPWIDNRIDAAIAACEASGPAVE